MLDNAGCELSKTAVKWWTSRESSNKKKKIYKNQKHTFNFW